MTKNTGYNNITFSKGMKYFMNSYSDRNTPPYITLNRTFDGEIIKVLEDNYDFSVNLKNIIYRKRSFLQLKQKMELN